MHKLKAALNSLFQMRTLILIACLISTVFAEHRLGVWAGWPGWVAYVLPGIADLYLIHATRNRKDVVYAVLVVVALCSTSYAVTMPWDPAKTLISIAVSDLAPIVLWRLHITHDHKMELLWGEKTVQAVHEQRDNGYVYEFLPSALLAAHTPSEDVSEAPQESPEDEPRPAVKLSKDQQEQAIFDGFTRNASPKDVAKETGASVATVYRRYKEYKADRAELVTA